MKQSNASGNVKNVVIIEKDDPCRTDMRNVLKDDPEVEIVGECTDLSGATTLFMEEMDETPDVIIACLDILKEAVASDAGTLMDLRKKMPDTRLIVTSDRFADEEILRMVNEGIRGFFLKGTPPHLITRCIRVVTSGGIWMDNSFIARVFEEVARCNEPTVSQDSLSGN